MPKVTKNTSIKFRLDAKLENPTWKYLNSFSKNVSLLNHCLPPSAKIPLTSKSENPNCGEKQKLPGSQRDRKWAPHCNGRCLSGGLILVTYTLRSSRRLVVKMFYDSHQSRPQQLSWVKCYFENKKKKKMVSFYSFKYFHWIHMYHFGQKVGRYKTLCEKRTRRSH